MSALTGKIIAVIGGSAGIGLAVAKLVMAEGAQVCIGSHDDARLDAALAVLGEGARGQRVDVRDEASLTAFFGATGPVDHLVYTAGDWVRRRATPGKNFVLADAQGAFDIRFWGVLRTLDAALPHMARDGSIVLTGGLLAHRPQKGQAISSAVTGAVEHLAKGLAVDFAPIRVNVVVPGFIATDVWADMPEAAVAGLVAGQPIERAGQAREVAEAYRAFMCSTYTTGQTAIVDGGMLLGS